GTGVYLSGFNSASNERDARQDHAPTALNNYAKLQSSSSSSSGKKKPFRSRPISANTLEDVASGSETNVKSPSDAVHSIFSAFRMNLPATIVGDRHVGRLHRRDALPEVDVDIIARNCDGPE